MSYYGYSHKSTQMNDWIRMMCKEPQDGLLVTDLDFIFYDYKLNRMKMIEVKTFGAKIKDWQLNIYKTLDLGLRSMPKTPQTPEYEGFYIVTMDRDNPETSTSITINDKNVTKEQLQDFLDFKVRFSELS